MTNPDELERLARAATPGPWEQTGSSVCNWHDGTYELEVQVFRQEDGLAQVRADAAFIAAANPATILALLSANREMRTATPDLTAVIAWLKNGCDPAHAVTELQIYQDRIARSALTTQRGDGE